MQLIKQRLLLPSFLLLMTVSGPALAATAPTTMQQAIDAQRKLAEASPNDPTLWNDLGNLLWTNHQEEEAVKAYKQALAADPSSAAPHYNLGLVLAGENQLKEALHQFKAVLETEPKSAWAHFQIGAIYQRQGQRQKAIAEFAQAFRLDPTLSFADVNPQVVANPLVTEALLLAFENAPGATMAPRAYSDPAHIAGLFLPPAPSAPAPAAQAAATAKTITATPSTSEQSGTVEAPASVRSGEEAAPEQAPAVGGTRVRELTPQNLHPSPQSSGEEKPAAKATEGGVRRTIIVPQVIVPATPVHPQTTGKNGAPQQPAAPAQGGTGQTHPGSVPSAPSTGRLDLHLVNDPAPAG